MFVCSIFVSNCGMDKWMIRRDKCRFGVVHACGQQSCNWYDTFFLSWLWRSLPRGWVLRSVSSDSGQRGINCVIWFGGKFVGPERGRFLILNIIRRLLIGFNGIVSVRNMRWKFRIEILDFSFWALIRMWTMTFDRFATLVDRNLVLIYPEAVVLHPYFRLVMLAPNEYIYQWNFVNFE